jgi:MFS family permease
VPADSNVVATRPRTASSSRAYPWLVVGMLWFICFFNYADRQAIASVLPKLETEFGLSKLQQGLIVSAFAWVYAAGAPFAGYLADRLSRKHLILGGCLLWSLVTMVTGQCVNFWQFVTVRATEGLGETFYFPASMSLVGDYHGRRTRSRAMSLHQTSVYAGTIAGSWFAAWAADTYGWRLGFYVFGGLGIVLAGFLYLALMEPRRGQAEEGAEFIQEAPLGVRATAAAIFRKPTAIMLLLGFVLANFVATIFLGWTTTFLVEKFHFKLTAAGLSGTVYIHIASACSVPLAGLAADLLARRFAGGRIFVQAAGLLLGSTFAFLVGRTSNVTTLILAMSAFGLCKGMYDSNIFASMYDLVEPRARASAAGIMNAVGWGAGALGPAAFGWLADHGAHRTEGGLVDKVANMSDAISWTGPIYVVGGIVLLVAGVVFAPRDILRPKVQPRTEGIGPAAR